MDTFMAPSSLDNTSYANAYTNQSVFPDNMLPTAQPLVMDQNVTVSEYGVCRNPSHKMLGTSDYVKLLWTTLAEFPGKTCFVLVNEKNN